MKYRSDIDGLRALAIVPVVLYHAFGSLLPGGFVGVDVFFVISGFLITNLIKKEIEGDCFSIATFYERRARRILPALVVMLCVVLIVGVFALPPAHLEELGASTLATVLFVSNINFWQSIGYFSTDADFWPLLHTWSLSVEEQFYLIHPVLLLMMMRFLGRHGQIALLVAGVSASLVLCIFASTRYPSASFYLLPFRYWELALGALCAFLSLGDAFRSTPRTVLASAGLGMIVVSMLLYRDGIPFPGYWAILPVVGSAIVVVFSPGTAVARILSLKPIVFIGLISYSLYLWHWPILAFARYAQGSPTLPVSVAMVCILSSVLFAYISWRFVETPFRRSNYLRRRQIAWLAGGSSVAFVALGASLVITSGLPGRLRSADLMVANAIGDFRSIEHCWGRVPSDGLCVVGVSQGQPTILIWGDSHAGALAPAFEAALGKVGGSGTIATRGACAPLIGVRRVGYSNDECIIFNREVLAWLQSGEHRIERVVLVARWNLNATGVRPPGESGAPVRLIGLNGIEPKASQLEVFEAGLGATVRSLRLIGLEVVLLDDTPEVGWNVPMSTFLRKRLGLPQRSGPDLVDVRGRGADARKVMIRVADTYGATFKSLNDELCAPRCILIYDGQSIYADDDHISSFGARRVIAPLLLQNGVIDGGGKK